MDAALSTEEQDADDAKSEENTRDKYKERGGVMNREKGRPRSRKLAMPSVRYRPGTPRVHLLANQTPPRISSMQPLSPPKIGLCVTPAARLRLVFQVGPHPTEWSITAAVTSTAPEPSWRAGHAIAAFQVHDLHNINRTICITRLPIKCSIADHLVLRLMQSNLCDPFLSHSRMEKASSA
jgi:hypothetical protein